MNEKKKKPGKKSRKREGESFREWKRSFEEWKRCSAEAKEERAVEVRKTCLEFLSGMRYSGIDEVIGCAAKLERYVRTGEEPEGEDEAGSRGEGEGGWRWRRGQWIWE